MSYKSSEDWSEETFQKVKLIAAAPSLLRHLIKCVEALELIGDETGQSMPLTVADAKKLINSIQCTSTIPAGTN